ncbi:MULTISPECIES: LxmA leader domain family RiPP [unclassified Streptomyces]|uniref:LxmA leader domain family RiPP n=1 Tax=unclassified Streptomyces TaxID=2593676 RepID=UPI002F90FFEE
MTTQYKAPASDDIELLQLMGGFESYTDVSELELDASGEAPASSPVCWMTSQLTFASVTATINVGC